VSVEPAAKPVLAIVGPTASGKSTLAINLALELGGEIINCDSVQVYQGIQIATAKVPLAERRGVPHHLIDFVSPLINYTAGDWAREAASKIDEIEARGSVPILAGGTGLYLRALRRPFFASPPTDERLRRRLTTIRERHGAEHLHRLLQRLDPASALATGLACIALSKSCSKPARLCPRRKKLDPIPLKVRDGCDFWP
jgi:tRNA dimethylallyltransferase